jgi:hypothetical protein
LKKLAFLGGAAGLGLLALLATQRGHAADRLDSPMVASTPMADINDVYAWMDGTNLNLAMSVSPSDDDTRAFGPDVQYVFHVHSRRGIGIDEGQGTETRVICTFESSTSAQCWVVAGSVTRDYIKGDPSHTDGIVSQSGKVRLFAGRRSDPFFFNRQGFLAAVAAVKQRLGTAPTPTLDAAGCPNNLSNAEVAMFAGNLGAVLPPGPECSAVDPANPADCFAGLNVQIVLVQLDKDLVNSGNNRAVGVWASTHRAP